MTVNIEEIMTGIRAEIAARGEKEEDLKLPAVELYWTDEGKDMSFTGRVKRKIKKVLGIK